MKIPRLLAENFALQLEESTKALILYGPRQAGKTTLVKDILSGMSYRTLEINADEERYFDVLSSRNSRRLGELVAGYELIFIDEAQRVPDIGINLKILIDQHPQLRLIVTGSSSLELAAGISEPLTGRKWMYQLFPIAQIELGQLYNRFELNDQLDERLVWGSYPEVFNLTGSQHKAKYLRELSTDYLYRDVLKLTDIRNPDKMRRLLKLLAFQIGSEVSLNELASSLEMSKETVARYLDLLEKSFVVFRLGGFNRNLRKEVAKSQKFYFCDLGIRNAVIDNFNSPLERNDVGPLWENFLICERLKRNAYTERLGSSYFWRTYTGAEIDYVEESQGSLSGFEIRFARKQIRKPDTFLREYQGATWQVVSRENWLDFVLGVEGAPRPGTRDPTRV